MTIEQLDWSEAEGPEIDRGPAEDLASEVDAEEAKKEGPARDIPDGAIAVPLAGTTVHVLAPLDWPTRANSAVQTGDFETWAYDCLIPGDYDVWCEVRDGRGPTIGDVTEMMKEFQRLTGQSVPKSAMVPPSLRRMRRR